MGWWQRSQELQCYSNLNAVREDVESCSHGVEKEEAREGSEGDGVRREWEISWEVENCNGLKGSQGLDCIGFLGGVGICGWWREYWPWYHWYKSLVEEAQLHFQTKSAQYEWLLLEVVGKQKPHNKWDHLHLANIFPYLQQRTFKQVLCEVLHASLACL